MDPALADLAWRGIEEANPWWRDGRVPPQRTAEFRRHAFESILDALKATEAGRGLVVLGPRRVGKTVLLHQVVEALLASGLQPEAICLLTLDDVALRGQDLGELLILLDARKPFAGTVRTLLLDEVQHSPDWSGWLKRLADRRDPYRFLATGSSATALRRGGQDAGVGRWRELTLYPWSFREHVQLRKLPAWEFDKEDTFEAIASGVLSWPEFQELLAKLGQAPPGETERLDAALVDYFLRGGFPEAALASDLVEARRRLRQDILDRSLGRDIVDVQTVDPRALERMFLRICQSPGGLWNEAGVARDLQLSRPTVAKYLRLLEEAFLVFSLPNLASPIKGQSKVYLVAPALRQALLGHDEAMVRKPEEWGCLVENAVAAVAVGTRPTATQVGFWRYRDAECDVVIVDPRPAHSEYIEVKRGGREAEPGLRAAATALGATGMGWVLQREWQAKVSPDGRQPGVAWLSAASWLYGQRTAAGGTLRLRVT